MTTPRFRNRADLSPGRIYAEIRIGDRIHHYPRYGIGQARLPRIFAAYNLGSRREQVMFYLEPRLIQLELAKQCLNKQITPIEYKQATWDHENSLGHDILEFGDIWVGGTDQITREWQYFEFDIASEDCAELGKWYYPPADRGELEDVSSVNTADFWTGITREYARAQSRLEYILTDYHIDPTEIPKTIGI